MDLLHHMAPRAILHAIHGGPQNGPNFGLQPVLKAPPLAGVLELLRMWETAGANGALSPLLGDFMMTISEAMWLGSGLHHPSATDYSLRQHARISRAKLETAETDKAYSFHGDTESKSKKRDPHHPLGHDVGKQLASWRHLDT